MLPPRFYEPLPTAMAVEAVYNTEGLLQNTQDFVYTSSAVSGTGGAKFVMTFKCNLPIAKFT